MNKFIIQFVVLLVVMTIVNTVLSTEIAQLRETTAGYVFVVMCWIAIGWYWTNIWDYFERKIKRLK